MNNENAIKLVKPHLDNILKSFLTLMNELDNEELVSSFENIMSVFEDEIQPYAVDICKHLTK
jgi:Holliday junction resolvase RusA-like endonuclease